jgi:hypothetical protein
MAAGERGLRGLKGGGVGRHLQMACIGVENQAGAVPDGGDRRTRGHQAGHPHGRGQDRDVAGGAALGGADPGEA